MTNRRILFALLPMLALMLFSCSKEKEQTATKKPVSYTMTQVATSGTLWTGIAISPDKRIFVNFPLWSPHIPMSVGEILDDTTVVPFPNVKWNSYKEGDIPVNHFICVQSVVCDADGYLWVLDAASPFLKGIVKKGPKLAKVDIDSGKVLEFYEFPDGFLDHASYLNDVRIDTKNKKAYITDSGIGGILIVDLVTHDVRRVLAEHPSTLAEDVILSIEGSPWVRPDGKKIQVNADGIALDTVNDLLYYQALTGRHLYRISTRYLLDTTLTDNELATHVETVGETGAADGIICGPDGRIYLTAIEESAVKAVNSDGKVEMIVSDSLLSWPDSFAFGPDGTLYVTASQVHKGTRPNMTYRLFKITRSE